MNCDWQITVKTLKKKFLLSLWSGFLNDKNELNYLKENREHTFETLINVEINGAYILR